MLKYDVIVAGGGFSGVSATIAAAREGMKVLLLEKTGTLGGNATNGLVQPFMHYETFVPQENGSEKKLDLVQGVFTEIVDELKRYGKIDNDYYFHCDYLKVILDRMVKNSGADVLFHSTVFNVNKSGRKIENVEFYNVSGVNKATARVFIDTTGDANIASLSGCEFDLGRKEDNLCQPMTLCFRVSGTTFEEMNKHKKEMYALYDKFRAEKKIKNPREDILYNPTLNDNVVHFNSTRVVLRNPTNPFDLSAAEMEAREQMLELVAFLKENFEFFKNAEIVTSASHIGVRESRMVKGEHLLTTEELKQTIKFPDAIAAGNYDIDIHNPEGTGTSHYFFKKGEYYTIPYRCLVPKDIDNLLVAGRCISCEHEAQASVRIMPICSAMGQAAGTAAAIAVKNDTVMKKVDVSELQNTLKNKGAFIGI